MAWVASWLTRTASCFTELWSVSVTRMCAQRPVKERKPVAICKRYWIWSLIAVVVFGAWRGIEWIRCREDMSSCSSNFLDIQVAIRAYRDESHGAVPADLMEYLNRRWGWSGPAPQCPASDRAAPYAGSEISRSWPNAVAFGSYWYLPTPPRPVFMNRDILILEPLANHGSLGCNVMFVDGSRGILPAEEYDAVVRGPQKR